MSGKKPTQQEYEAALAIVLTEHDKFSRNLGGHRFILPVGTNLHGALLDGVNFSGAFFRGCEFSSAVFEGTDISRIYHDEHTKFPRDRIRKPSEVRGRTSPSR